MTLGSSSGSVTFAARPTKTKQVLEGTWSNTLKAFSTIAWNAVLLGKLEKPSDVTNTGSTNENNYLCYRLGPIGSRSHDQGS